MLERGGKSEDTNSNCYRRPGSTVSLVVVERLGGGPLDFPFIVTCEYRGLHHAYYLSSVRADGVATYITPDRLAGTITIEGKAKARGEDQVGTCLGKTLKELRASGQAFDVKR